MEIPAMKICSLLYCERQHLPLGGGQGVCYSEIQLVVRFLPCSKTDTGMERGIVRQLQSLNTEPASFENPLNY